MNSSTLNVLSTDAIREAYNVVVEGIKILENKYKGESSSETEELRQRYMALFFQMVEAWGSEFDSQIWMVCNMYIYYDNLLPVAI